MNEKQKKSTRSNKSPSENTPRFSHLETGRRQAAIRGIAWAAVNSVAPAIIGLVILIATSRALSVDDFGSAAFAISIVTISTALVPLGFADSLVQRPKVEDDHLNSVFYICVFMAFIAYVIIFAVSVFIYNMPHRQLSAEILAFVGIRIFFDAAAAVPTAILSRTMSFKRMAVRTTLASLFAACVNLSVLAAGYGVWALAWAQVTSAFTLFVASILSANWRPNLQFKIKSFQELKAFGIYASGARIINLLNPEQFLIGSMAGIQALGLYNFSRRIFDIVNSLVGGSLNLVTYPLMSSLQTEREKLKSAFLLTTFLSASCAFPIFFGLAVTVNQSVPLFFGEKWQVAVPVLQAFCFIGALGSIGVLQASLINSQGHARWWLCYQIGSQGLSVLIILIFAKSGVQNIAYMIALKTLLYWPISVLKTMDVIKIRGYEYMIQFLPPMVSSAVMLVSIYLYFEFLFVESPVMSLLAQVGVGGASYVITFLILSYKKMSFVYDALKQK